MVGMSPMPSILPDNALEGAHHQEQGLQQEHLRRVDSSLNVLSFGFLATAVLISVFLVVALLERFLHKNRPAQDPPLSAPPSSQASGEPSSIQSTGLVIPEKSCVMGVSVLMPGQDVPTFIANPAPLNRCHEAYVRNDDLLGHEQAGQDVH